MEKFDSHDVLVSAYDQVLLKKQMKILMTDPIQGTIHKHLHIKRAGLEWLPRVPANLYPKLDTVESDSRGLNLRFPVHGRGRGRQLEVAGESVGSSRNRSQPNS